MIKFILFNTTILKLTLKIKDEDKVNMHSEKHETDINFLQIEKDEYWAWDPFT